MKKVTFILILAFLCALLLPCLISASGEAPWRGRSSGSDFFETDKGRQSLAAGHVIDELLVTFRPRVSQRTRAQILKRMGATILDHFPITGIYHVRLPVGLPPSQAANALRKETGIQHAEPNYLTRLWDVPIPNDPSFGQLWNLNNTGQTGGLPGADISALSAWEISTGSEDVVIAVIDTGIDYTHPDLAPNMWVNADEIPGNGIDDDANGYIDDVHGINASDGSSDPADTMSHGTHCAGIIGAVGNNFTGVMGVSPRVRIMALKSTLSTTGVVSEAVRSIEYILMMKRDRGVNVRAINASWYVDAAVPSNTLYEAIRAARDHNILFVVAAGNNGLNNDEIPAYPASYKLENIIAVAATDPNDNLANFIPYGASNYGVTSVHVGAPGANILSTIPGSYGLKSGTSMAAPHVCGLVALIAAQHPEYSYLQVKNQILSTVDKTPNLESTVLSGGRINAWRALGGEDITPPSVRITSPNGGETWYAGEVRLIRWEASDNVGVSRIDLSYSLDGGNTWTTIVTGLSQGGNCNWKVPAVASALALIRMEAFDAVGNRASDFSDGFFAIQNSPAPSSDTTSPSVVVISPNGGENWIGGDSGNVLWNAGDDVGVTRIDILYSMDPRGWSWLQVASGLPNSGSYHWYLPSTFSSEARVKVVAYDAAGNSGYDTSNAKFTIKKGRSYPPGPTPPHAQVISPNGGELWRVSETRTIDWIASDDFAVTSLNIYCSLDGGTSWSVLASGLPNQSPYGLLVPEVSQTIPNALIKIEAVDGAGNRTSDLSDGFFVIQPDNAPPTANAGPDQTVREGTLVTLDGSGSADPDDGIASYLWVQTMGPPVSLSNASTARAMFTAPVEVSEETPLVFQLTVEDTAGQTSTDSCEVRVTPSTAVGSIRVRTLTKTGSARPNVYVQVVQRSGGTSSATKATNSRGEAIFTDLAAGTYEVSRKYSFSWMDRRTVNLTSGEVVVEYRY